MFLPVFNFHIIITLYNYDFLIENNGKKKKKKNKKKKNNASQEDEDDEDGYGPPKPRNFLEAALYFSTVTLGTVSMANLLEPAYFFAPPLFQKADKDGFSAVFSARKTKIPSEIESLRYLQRRVSALFAVALSQSLPSVRPFSSDKNISSSSVSKTNYLKRSIGFFAVSLVDHLPPSMSSRLFKPSNSGGIQPIASSAAKSLALDDLGVPSPEILSDFWLALSIDDRIKLVQEECSGLAKGWINSKKTWCMCKYCKHRRLRLSDIFDHVYRAYYEDLEDLACRLKGQEPAPKTPHQQKIRKLLYKALSLVAEDILNTKSRLMLESISRLGKVYSEKSMARLADEILEELQGGCDSKKTNNCDCPNCDYLDGEDGDEDDDCYGDEREDFSDFDDLDIDEDGDFYEDFNYGEDDEYTLLEGDVAVDEAQLPSTLPSFYDMDLMLSSRKDPNFLANADHSVEGQVLFEHFISQIFQFHLVPAFLEHEAEKKRQELIEEEEMAVQQAKLKEEQKALAKIKKKERQRAAKASLKEDVPFTEPKQTTKIEEAPRIEATKVEEANSMVFKKKAVKKVDLPPVIPRAPIIIKDTSAFAVEDIAATSVAAAVVDDGASTGGKQVSKSARRKAKKKALSELESPELGSDHVTDKDQNDLADHELPPGLFGSKQEVASGSPEIDPPPPYTMFPDQADQPMPVSIPIQQNPPMPNPVIYNDPAVIQANTGNASIPTSNSIGSRFEAFFRSETPSTSARDPIVEPSPSIIDSIFGPASFRPLPDIYRASADPNTDFLPPGFAPVRPTKVVPGQDGFSPFDDWDPVRSSLFDTPLFPTSRRPWAYEEDEHRR